MQTLSRARFLARFMLAWFLLALGVAVASPLVNPKAMELICSAAGTIKLVQLGDGSGGEGSGGDSSGSGLAGHLLDCPLCVLSSAPSSALPSVLAQSQVQAHVLLPMPAAHIASRAAAPLPPRGPPFLA